MFIGKFYFQNHEIKEIGKWTYSSELCFYEVFKAENGNTLFLIQHIQRLYNSLKLKEIIPQFSSQEIINDVNKLIVGHSFRKCNVRINYFVPECGIHILQIGYIVSNYPTEKEYSEGVNCGLLFMERTFPNAKIVQSAIRAKADELMACNHLFEVFLVNRDNKITEGSKSNIILIKDNKIITPPNEFVLRGITLQIVLQIAKAYTYEIVRYCPDVKELDLFDSIAITGTSPGILPVKMINNFQFSIDNPVLKKLMHEFRNFENK